MDIRRELHNMRDELREEVRRSRDEVVENMRLEFAQTHERLDLVNGRVHKTEERVTRHDERIQTLFKRDGDERRRSDVRLTKNPTTDLLLKAAAPFALTLLTLVQIIKMILEQKAGQ